MFRLSPDLWRAFALRHAGEIHAWPGTHQELPGRIHIVLVRQPVGA